MDAPTLTTSELEAGAARRVTLRLFASARQAAGTGTMTLAASTVGDVLAQASRTFGPAWSEVAAASRTWVNGEPATSGHVLADGDEVAVLPPVSGGAA
jgi:molybdopterin converting factor small subunit